MMNEKDAALESGKSKVNSSGIQKSNNKEQLEKISTPHKGTDKTEERGTTHNKHTSGVDRCKITKQVEIQSKEVHEMHNEEMMVENREEESSHMIRGDSVTTPIRLFETNSGELRDNFDVEVDILKGPDLIEEEDEVMQQKKDTEEDGDMEYNIQQISKAGDLSPRHTNSLKNGARKGRSFIPLQVKTRSSRERGTNSDKFKKK
ncbi:hypothetical protein KY289_036583 [Solanum tuberosum]|nr:hypothetical protein KY289_036583 [Solanum tuberosum]